MARPVINAKKNADDESANATVADGDCQALAPATLSFAPGEVAKTLAVNLLDDATAEPGGYFRLLLSSAVNASRPATAHAFLQRRIAGIAPHPAMTATCHYFLSAS